MRLPSKNQMVLITVFTMIETVVLSYWLVLLGVPLMNQPASAAFLCGGLLSEHTLAVITGNEGPAQGTANSGP